jgi:hypothetical protein
LRFTTSHPSSEILYKILILIADLLERKSHRLREIDSSFDKPDRREWGTREHREGSFVNRSVAVLESMHWIKQCCPFSAITVKRPAENRISGSMRVARAALKVVYDASAIRFRIALID